MNISRAKRRFFSIQLTQDPKAHTKHINSETPTRKFQTSRQASFLRSGRLLQEFRLYNAFEHKENGAPLLPAERLGPTRFLCGDTSGRNSLPNLLPMAWLLDATVYQIDEKFFGFYVRGIKPRVISLCDVRRVLFARVPVLRRLDLE